MSKDNLVFGLAGTVIGIIIGALIANFSATSRTAFIAQPSPQQTIQQDPATQEQGQAAQQGNLPEGHPPVSQEQLKQQIAAQEEIVRKDPSNQEAIKSLGNFNFDAKNYDEASKWYQKALEKDPRNVDLITDLGSCFLYLGQPEKALDYYNKSLVIDPKHMQTLVNVGIAHMSMGDRAGAADAWDKVVALYPDNPETPMLRDAIKRLRAKKEGS